MKTDTRVGRLLFAFALGVYLCSAGGSLTTTDAVVTFDVTRNIVQHGSVALSGNLLGMDAHRGRDGRYYSPFGIGQSLYNIPFYLSARLVQHITGLRLGKPDTLEKAVVALGQTLLGAAIVWQAFHLAMALTGDLGASALAALMLAFASVLWPYARFGFNQPLACWTLLAAVHQALVGARRNDFARLAVAGAWLAASLLTRHEMMLAALPLAAWLAFDGRPSPAARARRLAAFGGPVCAGIAAWLVFNAVRFGNPLDAGYLRDPIPAFGSPILPGIAALLFSPSASLFLYSPVALVGVAGLWRMTRTGDRSAGWLFASIVALFLLFYASFGNWMGGRSYGSRYLLVVLPYCVLGCAALLAGWGPARRSHAFAVVMTAGVLLQVPGVLVDYSKVSQDVAVSAGRFTTEERQWQWGASPLVLNARALGRAVPDNIAYVAGWRRPPAVERAASDSDRGFAQQFGFSLDLWWLYLYYLRVLPRAALAVVVVAFLVFVTFCIRRLRQSVAAAERVAGVGASGSP